MTRAINVHLYLHKTQTGNQSLNLMEKCGTKRENFVSIIFTV